MSSISVSDTYTAVRGVKPATLEFFGAKDLKEGERVVGQMYPYPKGYKMRIHEGKRFSTTPGIDLTLWGMHCFDAGSASELLITEGELDAMSAYQMLNMKTPCISLPSATTSEKTWSRPEVMKFLMSFSRIYCSFDSDGKSDKYIEKLAGMLTSSFKQALRTCTSRLNITLRSFSRITSGALPRISSGYIMKTTLMRVHLLVSISLTMLSKGS
jgi:hypothetical protein